MIYLDACCWEFSCFLCWSKAVSEASLSAKKVLWTADCSAKNFRKLNWWSKTSNFFLSRTITFVSVDMLTAEYSLNRPTHSAPITCLPDRIISDAYPSVAVAALPRLLSLVSSAIVLASAASVVWVYLRISTVPWSSRKKDVGLEPPWR